MSGKHARLAASASHRWLACPASANATSDGGASIHSATGTFAHDIAAKCLADPSLSPSDWFLKRETVDGFEVECDLEMVDAVGLYIDEVNADLKTGDHCWVEMRLAEALARIDPDLGGTADYVRYRPATRHLLVVDFKYGSGVYVEALDNTQLKVYALGAMLECGKIVSDVTVRIVQPRFEGAAPVRDFNFKAHEILDFVADVQEAANLSRKPDAPFAAGEHCKFCPMARSCPELEKHQHSLLAPEFEVIGGPPAVVAAAGLVSPARIADALKLIPLVKERIKAIEEHAYQEALKGVEIPGFKLVDKRANRRWKSEEEVVKWAEARAIDPYAPREVISPAQMEKRLAEHAPKGKKKEAGKELDPFVERVSSGTALVAVTDERPPAKLVSPEDFEVSR